jgi:hypothetical protein
MSEGFVFDNTDGTIYWNGIPIGGVGITGLSEPYLCPSGVQVGDAVYLSGADSVDQAQADVATDRPVIGVVRIKPDSTHAIVQYYGECPLFGGLLAGKTYYLSATTPGGITDVAPSSDGNIVQKIGFARNATTLVVFIDSNFVQLGAT